jgi:hypothetical protein
MVQQGYPGFMQNPSMVPMNPYTVAYQQPQQMGYPQQDMYQNQVYIPPTYPVYISFFFG